MTNSRAARRPRLLDLPSGGGVGLGPGRRLQRRSEHRHGTAKFDFTLPAGPNGILPPFTLQYSAGSGDGPFGIGWSLGLMTIRTKLTPASAAGPDRDGNVLAGRRRRPGRHGQRTGSGRSSTATGLLIEFVNGSWSVTDKTDSAVTLGSPARSRIAGQPPRRGSSTAAQTAPATPSRYTWTTDGGWPPPARSSPGALTSCVFQYESRPDIVLDGTYGPPVTLDKRCAASNCTSPPRRRASSAAGRCCMTTTADAGGRYWPRVREQGHAADGSALAAPGSDVRLLGAGARRPSFRSPAGPRRSTTGDTDLADLNGDGLPDIVQLGARRCRPATRIWGRCSSALRTRWPGTGACCGCRAPNVTFADMSGDGNVDLLVLDRPFSGYYPLSAPRWRAADLRAAGDLRAGASGVSRMIRTSASST